MQKGVRKMNEGKMNKSAMLDWDRRKFLTGMSILGTATLLAPYRRAEAADGQLETTRIRFAHDPSICTSPQYLAEELLRLEGFTDVEYLPLGARAGPQSVAAGLADMTIWAAPALIPLVDAGEPIVMLAGVHVGCYELFANESIRSIRDLKGKTIAIQYFGGGDHVMLSSMLAYVGMSPQHDVKWIRGEQMTDAMTLFIEGKADAFFGYAQQPAELRAMKIGHVIINTTEDKPWSHYFCCMLAANREFVNQHPVAAKRALRAVLKAADLCASEPEQAARFLSDKLYEPRYAIGLEVIKSIPYTRWRDFNPEDTLRFHALRLKEVGMIKSTPQQIIERGSNFSFLNELKRELKA
jgi:NitT/TauT family transport system substrate-binding protein